MLSLIGKPVLHMWFVECEICLPRRAKLYCAKVSLGFVCYIYVGDLQLVSASPVDVTLHQHVCTCFRQVDLHQTFTEM